METFICLKHLEGLVGKIKDTQKSSSFMFRLLYNKNISITQKIKNKNGKQILLNYQPNFEVNIIN